MAWIDDRIWCHPKFINLTPSAFAVWVKGAAYSTGFGTRGTLTAAQQKAIGTDAKTRRELVAAGLWAEHDSDITYHDWDDHNGKRDDRRERERQRKREQRERWPSSAGAQDGAQDRRAPGRRTGAPRARADGSDGSDGSEGSAEAKAVRKTSSSAHLESLTAQPFVGFLVDEATRLGAPLTGRAKGQAAKILAELVAAGAEEQALRTGITRMIERGRPISALTDIVREAAVAPAAEPEVDYPPLPIWEPWQ